MGDSIRFKFHLLDDEGQEVGFLAKRGKFDGEVLLLGKDTVPIVVILRADRRFNRVILTLLQQDGSAEAAAFAVKSNNVKKLLAALNRESSKRWADIRRGELDLKGEGGVFRATECPYCKSTIDLTDFDRSPQVFCEYCDTIVTLEGETPKNEQDHALCDSCGYFSRPREFSTFYFYFALVVYGWRQGKVYVCGGCMRKEAWKMLFSNLIFILGVPFALFQLVRVYLVDKTGLKSSFSGLDKANLLARKGKMEQAVQRYVNICSEVSDYAGIRYNAGLALADSGDSQRAATQFENALSLCSNHSPSFRAACVCHKESGRPDLAAALLAKWDPEAVEEPPPAPQVETTEGTK